MAHPNDRSGELQGVREEYRTNDLIDDLYSANAKLRACLREILECDANAEHGNLCDSDIGGPGECWPSQSDKLKSALTRARELVGE